MALPRSSRLGPYEILHLLGAGGMGEVYRARDTRLGRDVAIKVLPGHLAGDASRRKRFEQEARASSALSHPNICTIHDIAEHDGAPYIVMEMLDGISLRGALRDGPLAIPVLLHVAVQVADALEAAHAAHIIHRDLTPANVFITTRGDAKILDFGIAKLQVDPDPASDPSATTATVEPPLTGAGRTVGTPGYAAPEQALGLAVDTRADLFSFGAVLYEMATGNRAFPGDTSAQAVDAVLHAVPAPAPDVNPLVPAALAAVIDKAIEKDASLRYQSAAEMKADLRRIVRDTSGATPSTPDAIRPSRPPTSPSSAAGRPPAMAGRRLLAAAVAIALFVIATDVAYRLFTGRTDRLGPLPESITREVTSGSFVGIEPALSPDGHTIAYVVDEGAEQSIWMVETRGGLGSKWTKRPGQYRHPAWAPDGRLFFEAGAGGTRGIYVAPGFDSEKAMLVVAGGAQPAVSPDGSKLAFATKVGSPYARISVADVDNWAHVVPLTTNPIGRWDHADPAWSPDGRSICYTAADGLWIVAAGGGSARQLSKGVDAHPAWSSSGFIYFASLRGGVWQLWRISADGRTSDRVTRGIGVERMPVLDRTGTVMVFSTASEDAEVVIRDLSSGRDEPLGGGGYQNFPSFGAGGRSIFFMLGAWNRKRIWEAPLSGGRVDGALRPLAPDTRDDDTGVVVSQPAVSPDGRWVAFLRIEGDSRDVYVAPAAGGVPVNVTEHPAADYLPAWSPDGTRIAFTSERDGAPHVWIQEIRDGRAAGAARRLSIRNAFENAPAWSPDGRRVAFVTGPVAGGEIAVADASRPSIPVTVTSGAQAEWVRWLAPQGSLLVSGRWWSERLAIRAVDPATHAFAPAVPAIDLGPDRQALAFDVTADGRYLAWVRVTRSGHIGVLEAKSGSY